MSLDEAKAIRWAFDVEVNDVILASASGALRRYLQSRYELPSSPRSREVPVSLRSEDEKSDVGTKVGAMFVSLCWPIRVAGLAPVSINDSTKGAKETQRALAADKIMGIT